MPHPIATILLRGSANDWWAFPFLATFVGVSLAATYWRFFIQRLKGIRAREWQSISALIDIVSVAKQVEQTGKGEIITYLASLTYFYRNHDLQTGDFCRLFDDETEAQAWADSYKGKSVLVHIDPRDPSNSVLRKEDL